MSHCPENKNRNEREVPLCGSNEVCWEAQQRVQKRDPKMEERETLVNETSKAEEHVCEGCWH